MFDKDYVWEFFCESVEKQNVPSDRDGFIIVPDIKPPVKIVRQDGALVLCFRRKYSKPLSLRDYRTTDGHIVLFWFIPGIKDGDFGLAKIRYEKWLKSLGV